MQKSMVATISSIIVIIIYTILGVTILSKANNLYTYLINPLVWILFGLILYKLLGKTYENKKLKKQIIQYTLIACLIYVIVYLLTGLFVTFGKNPYLNTFVGLTKNIWALGIPIFLREYIRYKLINNVYDKDKNKIAIIITIVFTIIEIKIWNLFQKEMTGYYVFSQILGNYIPIAVKNVLFSYLALNLNCSSAIIYEFLTRLYLWISPILPNTPWIVDSLVDTTIPIILLLYIRYTKNKLDRFRTKEKILNSDPKHIIPLVVVIILSIWFATGVFPIKPVSVASGSMQDELHIGDVVIIKKCNANDINVGDIIEYKLENYTVIHRVQEKVQKKGQFYFITKGDNNSSPDAKEVTEQQLIGKVIFKIRYIGYPAIWIKNLDKQNIDVQVET